MTSVWIDGSAGGIEERERGTDGLLDKFKTLQMVDVLIPTTDGRELVLSRYTLPEEPPPKITAKQVCKNPQGTATL